MTEKELFYTDIELHHTPDTSMNSSILLRLALKGQPVEQLSNVRCRALLGLGSFLLFLECHADKLTLLGLDLENSLLDRSFHDESPDFGLPRLTQTVHTIDGLVFDGRSPPYREN